MKKIMGLISLCLLYAIICGSLLAQDVKLQAEMKNQPQRLYRTKIRLVETMLGKWLLPNSRQPAKIQLSNTNHGYLLGVSMNGANEEALQKLKRQIERATAGQMMTLDENKYWIQANIDVNLKLKGNRLEMSFGVVPSK
jgi:hypothetical protein